ncbi:MAG: hypothetical protein ACKN82_18315 [Pirellula sp.]
MSASGDLGIPDGLRVNPSFRDNRSGFRVALSPSTSPQGGDELKR